MLPIMLFLERKDDNCSTLGCDRKIDMHCTKCLLYMCFQ